MGTKGLGGFGDEICEPSQIVRPENDYVLMILSRDEVAKRVDARQDGRGDYLRTERLLPVSGLRADIVVETLLTVDGAVGDLALDREQPAVFQTHGHI